MNRIPKVVFSNTLETAGWSHTQLVKGSAAEEVARLKQAPGKDLFIFGSANLIGSLTKQGLIDEYRIGLNPLVLGGGTLLFKPSGERMRLAVVGGAADAVGRRAAALRAGVRTRMDVICRVGTIAV